MLLDVGKTAFTVNDSNTAASVSFIIFEPLIKRWLIQSARALLLKSFAISNLRTSEKGGPKESFRSPNADRDVDGIDDK